MSNPLFTGLVAYVIREAEDQEFATFQTDMRARLEELNEADDLEAVSWYEDLLEHWLEHLEEDTVEESLDGFQDMIDNISTLQLTLMACDLRNEILIESLPDMTYKLVAFHALYSFRWEDGLQVEYSCRPVIRSANMAFNHELVGNLNDVFRQQLVELLISPGLDALHDQAAKLFSSEKFAELLGILQDYVNNKPANEREPYEHIIFRIKQQLSPGPVMREEKDIEVEWLSNGGGF